MKENKKKNLLIAGLAVATTVGLGCSAVNAEEVTNNTEEKLPIISEETNNELNEIVEAAPATTFGFLEVNSNIPEAGIVTIESVSIPKQNMDPNGKFSKYISDASESFTLTVTENKGYVFVGWYSDGVWLNSNYTYTNTIEVTGKKITAKFEKIYSFEIANDYVTETSPAIHVTYTSQDLPVARAGVMDDNGIADPNKIEDNHYPATDNFLKESHIYVTIDETNTDDEKYIMDGYIFKGWYNSKTNTLLTENRNYDFVIRENMKIEPRYEKIDLAPYLFDAQYYADTNKDVRAVFGNNVELLKKHYKEFGIKEGRIASPVFDAKFYLLENDDLCDIYGEDGYAEAYVHFVNYGAIEGRIGSPFYNVNKYWANYNGTKLSDKYSKFNALKRFVDSEMNIGKDGSNFNISSFKANACNSYVKNKLENNYTRYYAYFMVGDRMFDGNDPISIKDYMFDPTVYYLANPDLQQVIGFNSKLLEFHYNRYGIKEGRMASYIFDAKYYLDENPDLIDAFGEDGYEEAYQHFIHYGIYEGRKSSQFFDARFYIEENEDIEIMFNRNYSGALEYFITTGMAAGDVASEDFDVNAYKMKNPDLSIAYATDYVKYYNHYIAYGKAEGRECTSPN